jgi:hypothetical protein
VRCWHRRCGSGTRGSSGMPRPDPFACSIHYAEDWLRRARRDWGSGNAPAAVRRLMLAEAEIRHARETVAALDVPARRNGRGVGWRVAAGLAAAAVLAAGVGYASMRAGTPSLEVAAVPGADGRPRRGSGRTIVQLETGRYLTVDQGQDSGDESSGPGFTAPAPRVAGTPGDRWSHAAVPWPRPVGMPVDLRTSSPTF